MRVTNIIAQHNPKG